MSLLLTVWAWVLAHPLIVWPIVTGLVNIAFGAAEKYAPKYPKVAFVLGVLENAGLNVRGVLEQLAKVFRVKPPPLPALFMIVTLSCVGALTLLQCNAVKDAKAAADLIACIDAHVSEPAEQVAKDCAVALTPELVGLLEERKMSKITSKPCVIITVDAGAPKGPGL